MSYDYTYYGNSEIQKAEAARYRAVMRVRCLEKNIENADYEDFERLMYELERAREELVQAGKSVSNELAKNFHPLSPRGNDTAK